MTSTPATQTRSTPRRSPCLSHSFAALLSIASLAVGLSPSTAIAEDPVESSNAAATIASKFEIDDNDPEGSLPTPEEAFESPLDMGYLLMELAERADAALAAGRPAAAAKYYRAMGKAVPERAIGFRKACGAHDAAGERERAIETCRSALGKGGVTVQDHVAFIRVILKKNGALTASEVEDADAVLGRLGGELRFGADERGELVLAELRCQLAARLEDPARLAACTQELRDLEVEGAKLFAYAWALALSKRDVAEAKAVIERAQRAGLPAATVASMQRGLQRAGLADADASEARTWFGAGAAAGLLLLAGAAALRARRRSRLEPA